MKSYHFGFKTYRQKHLFTVRRMHGHAKIHVQGGIPIRGKLSAFGRKERRTAACLILSSLMRRIADCLLFVPNKNKYFLAGGGVQGRGRPSKHRKDSPTVVCSLCLSQLGKGKAHHCSQKTCLINLQQSLSSTTKDKITESNIRERRIEGQG